PHTVSLLTNSRSLATLSLVPSRFATVAPHTSPSRPASGLEAICHCNGNYGHLQLYRWSRSGAAVTELRSLATLSLVPRRFVTVTDYTDSCNSVTSPEAICHCNGNYGHLQLYRWSRSGAAVT